MKLPDVNVLVAGAWASHAHHRAALAWLKKNPRFYTCPITELGLVRVLMQLGAAPGDAFRRLEEYVGDHRQRLLPADLSATVIRGEVRGHRETTDAYLARLARRYKCTLATFDADLTKRWPQSELIPEV